jgi:hypothetical protein
VLKDFEKWKLTYKSFKKSLKNGKAPASVDVEEEDDDKPTLPKRSWGHKATASDMKKDAASLALSKTFKRWMADKEEVIAVREEKKHREKEANAFYDHTKKTIEVEESMSKAKATVAEAKLMAEERENMLVDTTNMTEGQKTWVEKRRAFIIQRDA